MLSTTPGPAEHLTRRLGRLVRDTEGGTHLTLSNASYWGTEAEARQAESGFIEVLFSSVSGASQFARLIERAAYE